VLNLTQFSNSIIKFKFVFKRKTLRRLKIHRYTYKLKISYIQNLIGTYKTKDLRRKKVKKPAKNKKVFCQLNIINVDKLFLPVTF